MNTIKLNDKIFQIPDDGINYNDSTLKITVVLGDVSFADLETAVKAVGDAVDIYDADGKEKTGTFNGYTKLTSIAKQYGDETKAEIVLEKPTLETAVKTNASDILTLQETVAELYTKVEG